MVDLMEQCQMACDELIDVPGRRREPLAFDQRKTLNDGPIST
jgi:hypothetical protein